MATVRSAGDRTPSPVAADPIGRTAGTPTGENAGAPVGRTAGSPTDATRPPERAGDRIAAWVAPTAWVALVGAAVLAGAGTRADLGAHVHAAPFVGTWQFRAGWAALPALALAAAAVRYGPEIAARLRWRALLAATAAATSAWAVALAWIDARAIGAPLATRYEYLAAVPRVGSVAGFLRTFVAAVPTYPTHVKSHPPGMVLVLWAMDRLGLGGAGPAAVLVVVAGAMAGVAALVALRELAGEPVARRAAPFVALAPAAVFVATSPDALFAGISAWGIALVVLATGRRGRRAMAPAGAGGLLLVATVYLSYGLALLLVVPAAVCVRRRRADVALVAASGVAAVAFAFAAAGFWWPAGLGAAHAAYVRGESSVRPYGYFLLADLAVFAVLVGPAAAAGLARMRAHRAWLVVGAALVAVAVADVTGLSKGEVERIWLPFAPWVTLACCAVPGRTRPWLAANVGTGFALQLLLRSPW